MQLIEAFVRNPVKISVGVLLVALFGFIALLRLPKQLTPEVEIPKISIQTNWRGASPEEVEREIVQEQEEQLQSVEGVTKLSAECSNSSGSITLEFAVGTDLSEALLKVNSRLQQVPEYPEDADEPVISTSDPRANAIAWFILRPRVASPEEIDTFVAESREVADRLEPIGELGSPAAAIDGVLALVEEQPELARHAACLLKIAPQEQIAALAQQNPDLAEVLQPVREAGDGPAATRELLWAIERHADSKEQLKGLLRIGPPEEIAAFAEQSRALGPLLERTRRAHNPGLATRRIRALVEEHPEIKARIHDLLPPDKDVSELRLFAEDNIESAFERVDGISNSNVYGGREEEMQVIVDPQRLAARGLTIMDVRRVLRAENRDISGGDLWDGKRQYVVRTLGRFRSPRQVADVILAQGPGGQPVYVRDVAEVRFGFKKPDGVVKNFGTVCMACNCVRETGANVLETMAGLREVCDVLNRDVLKNNGLELVQVYDETEYIYSSIDLVVWNIIIGGLLTFGVLLLFLRSGRSTVVIALAIPTSIIGTFLMLNLMGRSLNVISLAGLAFAVGMLVDNAVVVLENCYRHAQMGDDPFVAAVRGAKEVWGAVVASTLTTLAVFLPVLFVQEEAGQLFRDIALAISSAVGLSLIVSVTVIPTAAARLLRAGQRGTASRRRAVPHLLWPLFALLRLADALGKRFVGHVLGVNRFLQKSVLLRLGTVVLFVGTAILLGWLLMPKVEYLPEGNRNLVFGILLPPPGYNIDRSLELGAQLEKGTQPYWDIDKGDPAIEELEYPAIEDYFFVARGRQVFLGVRAVDGAKAGQLVPLVQQLAGQIPGTIAAVSQRSLFSREIATGRTVDIEITGPDLEKLVDLGRRIFLQVPQVVCITEVVPLDEVKPGQQVVERDEPSRTAIVVKAAARAFPRPSLDLSSPELHVLRRTKQASDLEMSTDEIGYTVDALVDGAYATDYYKDGDKIDLTIIGSERFARRTQDLETLTVATPTGQLVPLAALADMELAGGPEQINHRERQRAITISVTPPDEMPLEEAIEKIRDQIVAPLQETGEIGGTYRITLAGTADKLLATWKALRLNFLLALLITYLLMAALFESWLYPLVIILTVPFGAVGGLLGLWLLNWYLKLYPYAKVQSLDVLTMLGFVILIGTVVNNAILIVHQSLNHMRDEGMEPNDAILESVRTRIRPIFMTTTTTVLGLCPLVLFPGQGSELYRGLGAVVLGGLIVSTAFTLILVPTLFSLLMQAKASLVRLLRINGGQVPGAPAPSEPARVAVPR